MSTTKRPRVLIADDHPGVIAALERLLSFSCDIVGSVADGALLLQATTTLGPDVVLLDLNLASGNSLLACREIKRTVPHVKVIVMTGGIDASLRPHVLSAGASAFIDKTAVSNELLLAIE